MSPLYESDTLAKLVAVHPELSHLQIRKHGQSLILFSQDEYGPENHVRFTRVNATRWRLSFALHTGKWDATPFEDTLTALFAMVLEQFSFYLAKR
jgi:hypothetical protein